MSHGNFITKEEAKACVARFKTTTADAVNTPIGFWYDKTLIDDLVNQNEGATGIRVYIGMTESQDLCTILVAVDSEGNNLYYGSDPCLDNGTPCPDKCGSNPL